MFEHNPLDLSNLSKSELENMLYKIEENIKGDSNRIELFKIQLFLKKNQINILEPSNRLNPYSKRQLIEKKNKYISDILNLIGGDILKSLVKKFYHQIDRLDIDYKLYLLNLSITQETNFLTESEKEKHKKIREKILILMRKRLMVDKKMFITKNLLELHQINDKFCKSMNIKPDNFLKDNDKFKLYTKRYLNKTLNDLHEYFNEIDKRLNIFKRNNIKINRIKRFGNLVRDPLPNLQYNYNPKYLFNGLTENDFEEKVQSTEIVPIAIAPKKRSRSNSLEKSHKKIRKLPPVPQLIPCNDIPTLVL